MTTSKKSTDVDAIALTEHSDGLESTNASESLATKDSYHLDVTEETETMLKHYVVLVDLLKFYLELVLKFNIFAYAITGATVSFYLTQPNQGPMQWALVLPAFVNLGLAVLAFKSIKYVRHLNDELARIKVVISFRDVPDGTHLTWILKWSGLLCTIIGVGLIVVTFVRPTVTALVLSSVR